MASPPDDVLVREQNERRKSNRRPFDTLFLLIAPHRNLLRLLRRLQLCRDLVEIARLGLRHLQIQSGCAIALRDDEAVLARQDNDVLIRIEARHQYRQYVRDPHAAVIGTDAFNQSLHALRPDSSWRRPR